MHDQDMRAANWRAELANIIADIDRDGMPKPVIVKLGAKRRRTIKPAPGGRSSTVQE